MPTYDYQCNQCQTTFEIRASFKEKELGLKPLCPTCSSPETTQVLTSGLFLRGGDSSTTISRCGPNAGSGCCS